MIDSSSDEAFTDFCLGIVWKRMERRCNTFHIQDELLEDESGRDLDPADPLPNHYCGIHSRKCSCPWYESSSVANRRGDCNLAPPSGKTTAACRMFHICSCNSQDQLVNACLHGHLQSMSAMPQKPTDAGHLIPYLDRPCGCNLHSRLEDDWFRKVVYVCVCVCLGGQSHTGPTSHNCGRVGARQMRRAFPSRRRVIGGSAAAA